MAGNDKRLRNTELTVMERRGLLHGKGKCRIALGGLSEGAPSLPLPSPLLKAVLSRPRGP